MQKKNPSWSRNLEKSERKSETTDLDKFEKGKKIFRENGKPGKIGKKLAEAKTNGKI